MNPIERGIRTLDAWQQSHRPTAFAFAVFKKFGDDQGGNLVALLTYFAFLATFPLLPALSGTWVPRCVATRRCRPGSRPRRCRSSRSPAPS